jgi:hypothetical protein
MRNKLSRGLAVLALAGVVAAMHPAAGQEPSKQKTQDGNGQTTVGPGSAAYKQKTQDGNSPTTVGPGSAAYKQQTAGETLPLAGPASSAYKKN